MCKPPTTFCPAFYFYAAHLTGEIYFYISYSLLLHLLLVPVLHCKVEN